MALILRDTLYILSFFRKIFPAVQVNTDLQQRLQQTVALARMQVGAQSIKTEFILTSFVCMKESMHEKRCGKINMKSHGQIIHKKAIKNKDLQSFTNPCLNLKLLLDQRPRVIRTDSRRSSRG